MPTRGRLTGRAMLAVGAMVVGLVSTSVPAMAGVGTTTTVTGQATRSVGNSGTFKASVVANDSSPLTGGTVDLLSSTEVCSRVVAR